MLNRLKTHFNAKNTLAFIILFIYILALFVFTDFASNCKITPLFVLFIGIVSLFITYFLLRSLRKLPDITFKTFDQPMTKIRWLEIGCIFLATFTFYMIYFVGQFPGSMGEDVINQYSQAIGDTPYNNWHPVLHTLLFYTLPLKIMNHFGFIVFLQLLYFCLVFTYLIFVMHQSGCPKILLTASCVFVWVNPFLATYMMSPMKDIAMLILSVLLIAYYIRIICSGGMWLKKNRNLILFTLAAILCLYMRYNAIFFVAPVVAMALFYAVKDKKTRFHVAGLLLLFFISVQALYLYIDPEQPTQRTVEAIRLPVSVWCNVMKENPYALPSETQDFMYSLASQETYDSFYISAGFNSVKWAGMDLERLDTVSWFDIVKYTFQCFRYAIRESLEAVAKLTDFLWGIDVKDAPLTASVAENDWGITFSPSSKASIFVLQITTVFCYSPLNILFGSFGLELFVLLVIGIVLFIGNRISILHIIPLFCYDFGKMLLLSGRDCRFFLFNLPIWIPLIFLMFRDEAKYLEKEQSHETD